MTLGVFLPAVLILTGIIELVMIGRLRGKLPTRMDPDYEGEETGDRRGEQEGFGYRREK